MCTKPAATHGSAELAVIREFHRLSRADLKAVGALCHWRRYLAGQVILRYQDDSNDVFFIVEGTVRFTYYSASGHEVILADLSVGEIFGELSAIDGRLRSANAVARTGTLVASMPASAFLNLIHSSREVASAILMRLSGKVRRLTERLFDYSTLAVRSRIHAELLRMATDDADGSNTAFISPAPTHSDLANLISTHREAVTRELNSLTRNGLIQRRKQGLVILDLARLRQMVIEVRGGVESCAPESPSGALPAP